MVVCFYNKCCSLKFSSYKKDHKAKMVSIVAKTLKDRRQYNALVDIFQEADISNDGKVY